MNSRPKSKSGSLKTVPADSVELTFRRWGSLHNKQIFQAFLFNIRNYSTEVINIQLREAELNIILPRVNNFDIKQKRHGIFVLLYATNTKQDLGR